MTVAEAIVVVRDAAGDLLILADKDIVKYQIGARSTLREAIALLDLLY
jgi:hypothetical protein